MSLFVLSGDTPETIGMNDMDFAAVKTVFNKNTKLVMSFLLGNL